MRKNRKMSESRRPSVSFTAMPPGVLVNDSRSNSTDDIQIALAPHIQTYLSQTGRRHSCCSVMLPVAFERASSKSWMDPKFDSPVLEGQFQTSVFPHIRMRYRFALSYILICSLSWLLYFLIDGIGQMMPPKVADMLLNEGDASSFHIKDGVVVPGYHYVRPRTSNDLKS